MQVNEFETIVSPEPKPAPFTYTGRQHSRMTGFEFLQKFYGQYFGVLHQGHIRSFDMSLYRQLMKERRANGGKWPQGIDLPTKSAAIDREISTLSDKEVIKIKRLAGNLKNR